MNECVKRQTKRKPPRKRSSCKNDSEYQLAAAVNGLCRAYTSQDVLSEGLGKKKVRLEIGNK